MVVVDAGRVVVVESVSVAENVPVVLVVEVMMRVFKGRVVVVEAVVVVVKDCVDVAVFEDVFVLRVTI